MKFVHPDVLWGLLGLIIPILIHLVNLRRRRTVVFSNVAFLKQVDQSTKAKNKLRDWLILLARLLALSALVLAFARPYFPSGQSSNTGGLKATGIIIDNSFGLEGTSNLGTLLDDANQMAIQIVEQRGSDFDFMLGTNQPSFSQRRTMRSAQMVDAISSVEITSSQTTLAESINRMMLQFDRLGYQNKDVFVFSDFQSDFVNPHIIKADSGLNIILVPLQQGGLPNLSIDSAYINSSAKLIDGVNNIHVVLSNRGDQERSTELSLLVDEALKTRFELTLQPNAQIDTSIEILGSEEVQRLTINIEDDVKPIDNHFFGVIRPRGQRQVVILGEGTSNYIDSAFLVEPLFELQRMDVLAESPAQLRGSDVLILDELSEIPSAWLGKIRKLQSDGATIIAIPSAKNIGDLNIWLNESHATSLNQSDTSEQTGSSIAYDHRFFDGVFEKRVDLPHLPYTKNLLRLSKQTGVPLISTATDPMVVLFDQINRTTFLFNSPLSTESDWPSSDLFLPMLYRMAWYKEANQTFAFTLGRRHVVEVDSIREDYSFTSSEGNSFVPYQDPKRNSLILGEEFEEPGFYKADGLGSLRWIAFNYPRTPMDVRKMGSDELRASMDASGLTYQIYIGDVEDFTESRLSVPFGKELWRWFLVLVLIFLLFEILLLRSLK